MTPGQQILAWLALLLLLTILGRLADLSMPG